MSSEATSPVPQSIGRLGLLGLAALGVVFGDIGTSPLYTLKTVLDYTGPHPDPAATLGALSLILWTLLLITTVKYVNIAMRVDNDGEGGVIALMTLLGVKQHQRPIIVAVGLFGAALIYGDGAITPAISVLSALEGVEQIAPTLHDLRAACGDRDPARAVRGAAVRDGRDRPRVRPDHAPLVRRDRGARRLRRRAAPIGVCGRRSALRPRLSVEGRTAGISGPRRGVSLRNRGRGALCRHGAFRAEADPPVVEPRCLSGAHSQLRRPGRHRSHGGADRGQHFLPALPRTAADAAYRARDGRHRHRQPVDHHRRLFDDAPGDAARLAAAHDHHADFRGRLRPDLCRARSTGCS